MESPLLQYKKDRAADYPSVEEQLDMLWHELSSKGSIATSHLLADGTLEVGNWYTRLSNVKDKYPKPTELDVTEV